MRGFRIFLWGWGRVEVGGSRDNFDRRGRGLEESP